MVFWKRSKPKVTYFIKLSYSRETRAEISKNTFKDKKILFEILSREKSHFKADVFDFIKYENDSNKIFKLFVSVQIKKDSKLLTKLEADLKTIFDCNDIEIRTNLEDLEKPVVTNSDLSVKESNKTQTDSTETSLENQDLKKENLNPETVDYKNKVQSEESIDSVIKEEQNKTSYQNEQNKSETEKEEMLEIISQNP